jgi:nitroreductase
MQALKEKNFPDSAPKIAAPDALICFGRLRSKPGFRKRTTPSALSQQEIDVYAATSDGLFLYDAKDHQLKPVSNKDLRALTGRQTYVQEAPLNLIFVADYSRMGQTTNEQKEFYGAADTGFIVQNVYLFCASEGLATGVRALIDRPPTKRIFDRPEDHSGPIGGYPKK